MDAAYKQCLWQNFGAAIDMLKKAVAICPDEVWNTEKKIFYISYHTTVFLDYYLTVPAKNFNPALPYTLTDEHKIPAESVDDVVPVQHYNRQEVLDYLDSIREKCKRLISNTSAEELTKRWIKDDEINMHGLCPSLVENYSVLEILFYNLRHLQHHIAQLNFILRQKVNTSADWRSLAESL